MNHRAASLIFLMLAPLGLRAQQEASTLEELCRRAPYVASVRLSSFEENKTRILAQFQATHWWKGERKGLILFFESTRAHCGSALRGLKTGKEYLIFFEARGTDVQPLGGARGILSKTRAIESAVRGLLLTTNAAARARLLAGQLSDSETRVREDAALALASLPGLETSTAVTRALLLTHLDQAMQTATSKTRGSASLGSLLLANSRVDARKTAARAWSLAIDTEHSRLNSLGREVLLRKIGTDVMLAAVPLASATTNRSRLLLLEALQETRSPKALPWVEKLILERDPILRREATVTMLSLGSKPTDLARIVGKDLVLQAETLRAQRQGKPRLRAIRPR